MILTQIRWAPILKEKLILLTSTMCSLLGCLACGGTVSAGCPEDHSQLLSLLKASLTIQEARFKEEKYLEILEVPIRSEGTLTFKPPDYMKKVILLPQKEILVLENDRVSISQPDKNESLSFSLEDHPALQGLLNAIRFTLAGDRKQLEAYYSVVFKRDCPQWQMTLIPNKPAMKEWVRRIIIAGAGEVIGQVKWVNSSGELTVMTLEKALRE